MLRLSSPLITKLVKVSAPRAPYRMFSSHNAVQRLRDVFEEYRLANYAQEVPSRFQKELIKAADKGKSGFMTVEDIQALLRNIGAEAEITAEELEIVLSEAGATGEQKVLPVEKMVQLLR